MHTRRLTIALLAALMVCIAVAAGWLNSIKGPAGPPCRVTIEDSSYPLSYDQAQHATTIALTAKKLQMPNRAVTVAIATALQESKLENIDYGDRDSVGLFQQRPSQGWGTKTQILDPAYASTRFFQKLAEVSGWQDLTVNDAAQAVQRSGHPTLYEQWETPARLIARSVSGEEPATLSCQPPEDAPQPANQQRIAAQLARELGSAGIATELPDQKGWAVSEWLVARAQTAGIKTITFRGQRWSAKDGTWQASGANEPIVRIVPIS